MTVFFANTGWKPDKDTVPLLFEGSKKIAAGGVGVKNEARIALIRASSHLAVYQRKAVLRCVIQRCGGKKGLVELLFFAEHGNSLLFHAWSAFVYPFLVAGQLAFKGIGGSSDG